MLQKCEVSFLANNISISASKTHRSQKMLGEIASWLYCPSMINTTHSEQAELDLHKMSKMVKCTELSLYGRFLSMYMNICKINTIKSYRRGVISIVNVIYHIPPGVAILDKAIIQKIV